MPEIIWFHYFTIQPFSISHIFTNNARLKSAKKNEAKAKHNPEAELLLFESYSLSSFTLSTKNYKRYSKKCTKNKCVCFNEVIRLMTMKTRLEMKHRSHRYDINRPRPRHGHKCIKYKICLSITIVIMY